MSALAAYASRAADSRGRRHPEYPSDRPYRTIWSRDRDRIVHSSGFRRLRGKTQVFVAPDGDHYRVRLTHSLEVAQIGRSLARGLGLDEDLTEAICLAHDIGHPPFGHAGEDALAAALADVGGFDHNAHTLRVLTTLDSPYQGWRGLNLSWETLEGLAKHNGPVAAPPWALAEVDAAFPLALERQPSLEAQAAAVADDIAYDNHDADDGVRAGLLDADELCAQPLLAAAVSTAGARVSDIVRTQIGLMVDDVLAAARARIAAAGVTSAADVRAVPHALVGFSDALAEQERAYKAFMLERLYRHPQQRDAARAGRQVVAALAAAYRQDPALLPPEWRERLPDAEPARTRHLGDFIGGMTDRFALARYRELIGPPPALPGV